MHTCPVCGYDQLRFPPDDYTICPSCGTKFGYSDATKTYGELQSEWLLRGARWHSNVISPPPGWNPRNQLLRLNAQVSNTDTFSIPSEVQIFGVPAEDATVLSRRIEFFDSPRILAAYAEPIHA